MLSSELEDKTRANIEVALERACRRIPPATDCYEVRKLVAERLIKEVQAGTTGLVGLTKAANEALSALRDGGAATSPEGLRKRAPMPYQSIQKPYILWTGQS